MSFVKVKRLSAGPPSGERLVPLLTFEPRRSIISNQLVNGTTGAVFEARPAERIVQTFVPMKWPEYLHVTDLPFSELLYATLR
jgi:hypothetical protein